jgi:hypothetical protein
MGIYNNIHDPNNDDSYYYCSRNDCPCHQHDFYDSSRNINLKYEYNDEHNVYFNYDNHNDGAKYDNNDKYDDYNIVNDEYYNNKFNSSSTR